MIDDRIFEWRAVVTPSVRALGLMGYHTAKQLTGYLCVDKFCKVRQFYFVGDIYKSDNVVSEMHLMTTTSSSKTFAQIFEVEVSVMEQYETI